MIAIAQLLDDQCAFVTHPHSQAVIRMAILGRTTNRGRAPVGAVDPARVRAQERNTAIRAVKEAKMRQMEGQRLRFAPRKGDVDSDDDSPSGQAVQGALDNDIARVASGEPEELTQCSGRNEFRRQAEPTCHPSPHTVKTSCVLQ